MPSDIEQSYLEQGYRLPPELSWDIVERHRRLWDIDPVDVPIAMGGGCTGWGVPVIGGKHLKHP